MTTEQATKILQMFYDYGRLESGAFDRKYGFGWAASLRDEYAYQRSRRDNLDPMFVLSQADHSDAATMLDWLAREALVAVEAVQR